MTDTTSECEYLDMGEVARRYGKAVVTIGRWIRDGVWRHGQLVKLRAIWLGGRRATTASWVDEFLSACNASVPVATETPSAAERRARKEQADLARKLRKG